MFAPVITEVCKDSQFRTYDGPESPSYTANFLFSPWPKIEAQQIIIEGGNCQKGGR